MDFPGQLQDQLYRCTRCGACLEVCPSYLSTGDESLSPRGRISLAEALADGRLALTGGLAARLSRCLGCLACASICPSGVNPPQIIITVKNILAAGGRFRLARGATRCFFPEAGGSLALRLAGALEDTIYQKVPGTRFLPFYQDGQKRTFPRISSKPLAGMLPRLSPAAGEASSRIIFFPGCVTAMFYPGTALAAVAALNRAGADVISPAGLACCGKPLQTLGDAAGARSLLEENIRVMANLDADAIVAPCPSCALTLREGLARAAAADPAGAGRLPETVLDIHEFLAARPPKNVYCGFREAETAETGVTWHDPCQLKYGLGITAQPRKIIGSLPGVNYIETADGPSCCGGGGLFSLFHYGLALKIGARRADAIAASGAGVVVTACPSCRMHLSDMLIRAGVPARVVHTVDLLEACSLATSPVT